MSTTTPHGVRFGEAVRVWAQIGVNGVVLNLAVWFTVHTAFVTVTDHPVGPLQLLVPAVSTVSAASVAISAMAAVAVFRTGASTLAVIAGSAAVGALLALAGVA